MAARKATIRKKATDPNRPIELGNRVRDMATGFEGIALSKIDYLTGCTQIGVAAQAKPDATDISTFYIDRDRLEFVDEGIASKYKVKNPGGPVVSSKSLKGSL